MSKKKPKRNSRAEKYSYWNEKCTRWIQRKIWARRKKNQWTWRKDKKNDQVWGIERKKIKVKWTEPWDIMKWTNIGVPEKGEREKGRENIWWNNGQNCQKFDERHGYKHPKTQPKPCIIGWNQWPHQDTL